MPTLDVSEALARSLAVAPSAQPEFYTFEFVRATWEEPVRIVYGWQEIEAKLEDGSESGHGGETVTWHPIPMKWTLQPTLPDELPRFEFEFYDPSRLVIQHISSDSGTPEPIQMYLRVYLADRFHLGPEMSVVPRYHDGSLRVKKRTSLVTGYCNFQDWTGRSAPFRVYTLAEFPGLRRR